MTDGGWLQDAQAAKEISSSFTVPGLEDGVGANRLNWLSFIERRSLMPYDETSTGPYVRQVTPQGDASRIIQALIPSLSAQPLPAAQAVMAPDPARNAAAQERTPGFGISSPLYSIDLAQKQRENFAPAKPLGAGKVQQSLPLGTNFSQVGMIGSRMTPRPKSA